MNQFSVSLRKFFTTNLSLKFLSFLFAAALWVYVSMGQTVLEVPKQVTLELKNLPGGLIRTSDVPGHIEIKVLGYKGQLRSLDADKISYELDLSNVSPGNLSFKVINTRIKGIPSGLKITEITPSEVSISFSERVEKTVPVEVITQGEPAFGFVVEEKSAEPALVKVSGAREEVENLKAISTEIINLSGLRESYHGVHALDVVGRHIDILGRQEVKVSILIVRDMVQMEFAAIAVSVENTKLQWSPSP